MTLQEYLIIVLTVSILLTGGVFFFWLQELRGCEDKLIEYYKINKTLGMFVPINESGPITPAGTPQEGPQSIVIELPGENISDIMACLGKSEFNLSEWEACNKIIQRPVG